MTLFKKSISIILVLALVLSLFMMAFAVITNAVSVETGTVGDKTYILGDRLYYTDFDDETLGGLPDGWEMSYTKTWGYNGGSNVGTATVAELGSEGKVLTYGANGVDTFLSMPEIKTRNYVYEIEFLVAAGCTSGSFGIANGMYGGIESASGAVFTSIPVTSVAGKVGPYYRSKGVPSIQKVDFTVPYKTTAGTYIKMKIISLDGENHLYFNDTFIGTYPQGESDSTSDWVGAYTYNGSFHITEVSVTEIVNSKIDYNNVKLSVDENVSINAEYSFDKSSKLYQKNISGDYTYSNNAPIKFGAIYAVSDTVTPNNITKDTNGVTDNLFTTLTQTDSKLYFNCKIEVPAENLDKFYEIRPYILIGNEYFYSDSRSFSAARLANSIYTRSDDATKTALNSAFALSNVFKGENIKTLKFTLFSDFHYKENMYTVSIADLRTILNRAVSSDSAFIISAGDFCNDFAGSPELTNTYLNYKKPDGTLLSAYNIYGNHELETTGNSMDNVTATLTNDKTVVWGTNDGSFDSNIGYYYFEEGGFRIVCVDTNYSLNSSGEWVHNLPASYGAPSGNTKVNSLGDVQLKWLEDVLTDAANKEIPCIVVSHDGFSGKFATSSSDAQAIRAIYSRVNAIKAGTVIMSINGHHHTNHQGYNDGVFYFDMNTTRNGYWYGAGTAHYSSNHTYIYEQYDDEGNLIDSYEKPITDLYQSKNTWFFEDPVSAVVTVDEFGTIVIDGIESSWMYDVVPDTSASGVEPKVTIGSFWDCDSLGHSWSNTLNSNDTHHWYACENPSCSISDVSLNKGYATHVFEEIEDEKFLVKGTTALYYKSCTCGVMSEETFGEGSIPVEIWGGKSDVATAFAGGDGTIDNPYKISNGAELAYLMTIIASESGTSRSKTSGKYYELIDDIYLNDVKNLNWKNNPNVWYSFDQRFGGNLNGNGYTVYGLYFDDSSLNYSGLIPVIDSWDHNVTVKNITISDSYLNAKFAGGITGRVYGGNNKIVSFLNCDVLDSVTLTGASYSGGFVGFVQPASSYYRLIDCTANATVSSNNKFFGYTATNLVTYDNYELAVNYSGGNGTYSDPYQISNSSELLKLVFDNNTAGKYYLITNDINLNDSLNDAKQWCAFNKSAEFVDIYFQGTLDGNGHKINGFYYNGTDYYVGLFVAAKNAKFRNIIVTDSSVATTATGGSQIFVGYVGGPISFSKVLVDETVSISGANVGAFAAWGSGNITIDNCAVYASLTGTTRQGAFLGDIWSSKHVISNSISIDKLVGKNSVTSTNNYSTVEDTFGTNVITLDEMKGANAKNNMPLLSWDEDWFTTDGYPSPFETEAPHEHVAGDWEVVRDATVDADGLKVRKCSVCGETLEEKVIPRVLTFASKTLGLKSNIALIFRIDPVYLTNHGYTNLSVVFNFNNKEYVVTDYTVNASGLYEYRFSDAGPHQMLDNVTAVIKAEFEGEVYTSEPLVYSIATYCYTQINALQSYPQMAKLVSLLVDMLNYGAAAQNVNSYNTSNLANASLTEKQLAFGNQEVLSYEDLKDMKYATVENSVATFNTVALAIKDSIAVSFKFTMAAGQSIDGLVVRFEAVGKSWDIPASEFTYESANNRYVATLREMNPSQMKERILATLYKDGVIVSDTASYSIESYGASTAMSIPSIKTLVEAMVRYGRSAKAYNG